MRAPAAPEMRLFLEKVYAMPESQVTELIAAANHGRGDASGDPGVNFG